jgi:hypothetical protein
MVMATRETALGRAGRVGLRAHVTLTALSLAAAGSLALWQIRPAADGATPRTRDGVARVGEGAMPFGGLAELYAARESAAPAVAPDDRTGGMAELYRDQARDALGRPTP